MYWKNSNFQIANFIVGKCFTADEAYRVLQELRIDRQLAIDEFKAFELETSSAMDNLKDIRNPTKLDRAKSIRLHSSFNHSERCYNEAVRECAFIDDLLRKLDPLRKYKHLPDHEAYQACQNNEWRFKLESRARLSLMTAGSIPAELLETISCHPESMSILSTVKNLTDNPLTLTPLKSPLLPLLLSKE